MQTKKIKIKNTLNNMMRRGSKTSRMIEKKKNRYEK